MSNYRPKQQNPTSLSSGKLPSGPEAAPGADAIQVIGRAIESYTGIAPPFELCERVRAALAAATPPKRRRMTRAELHRAYDQAASDPAFLAEQADITKAFEATVGDGLAAATPPSTMSADEWAEHVIPLSAAATPGGGTRYRLELATARLITAIENISADPKLIRLDSAIEEARAAVRAGAPPDNTSGLPDHVHEAIRSAVSDYTDDLLDSNEVCDRIAAALRAPADTWGSPRITAALKAWEALHDAARWKSDATTVPEWDAMAHAMFMLGAALRAPAPPGERE